jgi:hypothetical protein
MANARVQNGTLSAANPLFYMTLVRDDGSKGDVFRNTHWLPLLVNSLPQHHLARPRAIGIR